jgi:hypothetical protein
MVAANAEPKFASESPYKVTDASSSMAVVDIGLVEKPFQHACLKHLQDCVVNGN